MLKYIYKQIFEVEENHWWHKSERNILLSLFSIYSKKGLLLNAGCGTGITSSFLKKQTKVVNIDISEKAIKYSLKRNNTNHIICDCSKLSFKDNIFDTIIADNVIEHVDNDFSVITEFERTLKRDGVIILSVPTYNFLWTLHDKFAHHKRRYNKDMLMELVKNSNLKIVRVFYWNFILFLPIVLFKIKNKFFKTLNIGLKQPHKILNDIFIRILKFEHYLVIKHNLNPPFGISLFVVIKKEFDNAKLK